MASDKTAFGGHVIENHTNDRRVRSDGVVYRVGYLFGDAALGFDVHSGARSAHENWHAVVIFERINGRGHLAQAASSKHNIRSSAALNSLRARQLFAAMRGLNVKFGEEFPLRVNVGSSNRVPTSIANSDVK